MPGFPLYLNGKYLQERNKLTEALFHAFENKILRLQTTKGAGCLALVIEDKSWWSEFVVKYTFYCSAAQSPNSKAAQSRNSALVLTLYLSLYKRKKEFLHMACFNVAC